jgi:hypothetical protein
MGNADSKSAATDNESTVNTDLKSKDTDFTSHDGDDEKGGSKGGSHGGRRPRKGNSRAKKELQSRDDEDEVITHKITDDQVNVNLAMADLMAYLQVVANNSSNLPLTRRDDPELDRTVISLTSEEYARKSAAFVPADIRVIGATFTRYGHVWDLPTSEVRSETRLCVGRSYVDLRF